MHSFQRMSLFQVYIVLKFFASCWGASFHPITLLTEAPTSVPELNLPNSEYSALQNLYDSTNGTGWNWDCGIGSMWNFTDSVQQNPCSDHWMGIDCSPCISTCNVIGISLAACNLTGTLPASIGNFSELNTLQLDSNSIKGRLPSQIGQLTDLQAFSANTNFLSGTIPPSINLLRSLTSFDISVNEFIGTLPEMLDGLTAMKSFAAYENNLHGPIPMSMTTWTGLTQLQLYLNHLSGTLSEYVGNWTQINDFTIAFNSISGSLPIAVGAWTECAQAYFSYNKLTGTIPTEMGLMTAMTSIFLQSNQLQGTIPTEIENIFVLVHVDISKNHLQSSIPTQLCSIESLEELYLDANSLTGAIPACLEYNTKLSSFNLSSNLLSCSIPEGIATLEFVEDLFLSDNFLTDKLPPSLSQLSYLTYLDVSDNYLSGNPVLTTTTANIQMIFLASNIFTGPMEHFVNDSIHTGITNIDISNNHLSGSVPSNIFLLPALHTFAANENCFSGTIPISVCKASVLIMLTLNGLSASSFCTRMILPGISTAYYLTKFVKLPESAFACLLQLPSLESLYLAGNLMAGTFPSCSISPSLTYMSLSNNQFNGTIPDAVMQKQWNVLDLSYNKLTGTLSSDFVAPTSSISLQVNRLSGHVPSSFLEMTTVTILNDNIFYCNLQESDLPQQDPAFSNYACGSDHLNNALYTWVVAAAIAGLICARVFGKQIFALEELKVFRSTDLFSRAVRKNLQAFVDWEAQIRYRLLLLIGIVYVVFIPLYAGLSTAYTIFSHKYAWTASALFLSGVVPTAVIIVMLCLLSGCMYMMFGTLIMASGVASAPIGLRKNLMQRLLGVDVVLVIVYFLNLIIIGGLTTGFLFIALFAPRYVVSLSSLFIAIFKLVWNGPVLKWLIIVLRTKYRQWNRYKAGLNVNANSESGSMGSNSFDASRSARLARIDSMNLKFRIFLGLSNSIILPCIVTALLDPSCFSDVLTPPSPIINRYKVDYCQNHLFESPCVSSNNQSAFQQVDAFYFQETFHTPFVYSYQCSSIVIRYFAPVYIYSCIVATFVFPLLSLWLEYILLNNMYPKLNKLIELVVYIISATNCEYRVVSLFFEDATIKNNLSQLNPVADPKLSITSAALNQDNSEFTTQTCISPASTANDNLQDNGAGRVMTNHSFRNHINHTSSAAFNAFDPTKIPEGLQLFRKDIHLVQLINNFAVLMTFGILVPLVGFPIVVSIIINTYFTEYRIGSLLILFLGRFRNVDAIGLLSYECSLYPDSLSSFFATILFVASLFWSFLLFDMLGDVFGFGKAGWAAMVILIVILFRRFDAKILSRRWQEFQQQQILLRMTTAQREGTIVELPIVARMQDEPTPPC